MALSFGSMVSKHTFDLINNYLNSGNELQDFCDAYGKHAAAFSVGGKPAKKPATPKKGAAPKGKKVPVKVETGEEDEAESENKVFILHDTTAKSHGVFCRKQDEDAVAEALTNGGKESIPATLTKMKYKYHGYPFDKSILTQVKKALATLDGFEVIEVKDLKKFEMPEGQDWSRVAPKKAPAKSTGKGKGKKSKTEEVEEEEEAEEEEEEAPKKKAPVKAAAGKKAGPSPGAAKFIATLGLKKNKQGNLAHAKYGLVFLELKVDGKPKYVCVGTQGESTGDEENPLETIHPLNGDEADSIKALSKTAKTKILTLTDVANNLDEETIAMLTDNSLLAVDDEEDEEVEEDEEDEEDEDVEEDEE